MYFFGTRDEDDRLDDRNVHFWRALLGHVRADGVRSARTLLDHGCHTGGLTSLATAELGAERVWAVEPVLRSRQLAEQRLRSHHPRVEVNVLPVGVWSQIPDGDVDLLLSHEVLYLVEDLTALFNEVVRVLNPQGSAYFVLGCHTENPIWPAWKQELEEMGHVVYDHSPFDVLRAGAAVGLSPALRPLRDSGWVYYDPRTPRFAFASVRELLDHQFRHKLLFRFLVDGHA